jgi:uncharacterized membrane-anchored protein
MAKKLGLLAIAAAFFAKFTKLTVLAAIGALVAIKKFFFGAKSSPKIKTEDER